MRSFRTISFFTFAVAVAAGCTLVNSFDEVKPRPEAVYTTAPRVEEPLPEAGISDATVVDAAEAGPLVDHMPIVVAGVVEAPDAGGRRDPVLAVLDAKDGREIGTREAMHVAGIAHETKRDVWYIFEAPTSFVTSPADVVHLHIRKLDPKTGAWTEESNTVVPTLFFYDSIAVTNDRLTFMAHPAEAGGSPRMITLDTSNLAAPLQIDVQSLQAMPVGMIATPRGSAGGYVTLLNVGTAAAGECEAGVCAAKARRYLIPSTGPVAEVATFTFGAMTQFGSPSYGSVVCGGSPDDLFILPKSGAGPHDVHAVSVELSTSDVPVRSFAMNPNTTLIRRLAFDNTHRVAFVAEANNDTSLYAVPLDTNVPVTKAPLRHSGQAVYFDHASDTAFSPFNQGESYTFSAFKVSVSSTGTIQLRERVAPPEGDWEPPKELRPILLGIRQPATYNCP